MGALDNGLQMTDIFVTLQGRCVFASGSPFPAVTYNGKTFHPGQGNNAYIFPGIALATILCDIRSITDEVFLESAKVWTTNTYNFLWLWYKGCGGWGGG